MNKEWRVGSDEFDVTCSSAAAAKINGGLICVILKDKGWANTHIYVATIVCC
jgi:hypothetical protein